MKQDALILGVDIGGTSVKSGIVDARNGTLVSKVAQVDTPRPATPEKLRSVVIQMTEMFDWTGIVGLGYPGVVKSGMTWSAAHLDKSWIGFDALKYMKESISNLALINDADAAGIAEMTFGAGMNYRESDKTVFMATFGTGIGSALFVGGCLVPNTEFGHLELGGVEAETRAAASVRTRENLDWRSWAGRVDVYLQEVEKLISPELIIIGGGVSENFSLFAGYLNVRARVVAATLRNDAGIIGSALHASRILA